MSGEWYEDFVNDAAADAYRVHRARRKIEAARVAMARFCTFVWCEALAQLEAGSWNPMPHEGNNAPWMLVYRRRALAIAIENGVLGICWSWR